MRNHSKRLLELAFVLMFVLLVPTSFAFTETYTMSSATSSYTRTIFPEVHQGRIQFSFTANVSIDVSITDSSEVVTLWSTFGFAGSCDLDVNASDIYRAKFTKSPGYPVFLLYTVVEQSDIPGFALFFTALMLLSIIGLIYLRKRTSFRLL